MSTGTDAEGPQDRGTRDQGEPKKPVGPANTTAPEGRRARAAPQQPPYTGVGQPYASASPRGEIGLHQRDAQTERAHARGRTPPHATQLVPAPPDPGIAQEPDRGPRPADLKLRWQHTGSGKSLCDDGPGPPPPAETTRPPTADPPAVKGPRPPRGGGEGRGGAGRQEKREEEGRRVEQGRGSSGRAGPPPSPRASQSAPGETGRRHSRNPGQREDPAAPELKRRDSGCTHPQQGGGARHKPGRPRGAGEQPQGQEEEGHPQCMHMALGSLVPTLLDEEKVNKL